MPTRMHSIAGCQSGCEQHVKGGSRRLQAARGGLEIEWFGCDPLGCLARLFRYADTPEVQCAKQLLEYLAIFRPIPINFATLAVVPSQSCHFSCVTLSFQILSHAEHCGAFTGCNYFSIVHIYSVISPLHHSLSFLTAFLTAPHRALLYHILPCNVQCCLVQSTMERVLELRLQMFGPRHFLCADSLFALGHITLQQVC